MNQQQSARTWSIKGTVQGVGFRFFVQHKAVSLGLTGWARNLADGTVEVYACGPSDRLDDLASALHLGPSGAKVRSVEQQRSEPRKSSGFQIR